MIRLRSLWFQLHKWLGITLAVLIIPLSLSGSALVWHDWLDEQVHPQRFAATGAATLSAVHLRRQAHLKLAEPGERISALEFPGESGSVQATLTKAAQGRRTTVAGDGLARPQRLPSRSNAEARATASSARSTSCTEV